MTRAGNPLRLLPEPEPSPRPAPRARRGAVLVAGGSGRTRDSARLPGAVASAAFVRPARAADVDAVLALMSPQIAAGNLLPRSREDVLARLDEFLVLEERGPAPRQKAAPAPRTARALLGVVALHHYGSGLAEVRSLTIASAHAGRGLGRRLLGALVASARAQGLRRLIALTRTAEFFEKAGFERTDLEALPEKVARDCRFCPKRDSCDEVAMELGL